MRMNSLVAMGFSTLLLAGCGMHGARVKSVNLSESGTYVVTTPGALTVARQSASAWHTCTLRVGGPGLGKHEHHHGGPRAGAGAGARGGGPSAALDVLLFRLCEARANNDISAEQYASSVQTIMKTISAMAERRPPPPGPGMAGRPPGPGGQWFHKWMEHEHGDHDGKPERHEGRGEPDAHPGPHGGPPPPPAHKGDKKH